MQSLMLEISDFLMIVPCIETKLLQANILISQCYFNMTIHVFLDDFSTKNLKSIIVGQKEVKIWWQFENSKIQSLSFMISFNCCARRNLIQAQGVARLCVTLQTYRLVLWLLFELWINLSKTQIRNFGQNFEKCVHVFIYIYVFWFLLPDLNTFCPKLQIRRNILCKSFQHLEQTKWMKQNAPD